MTQTEPVRVLIVRVGAMGDILHALPAVAALRERHPDWTIDWAAEPRWNDLLVDGPVVNSVIPVNVREWKSRGVSLDTARDVMGLRKKLRAARYDLCVDLQGSVRSGLIGWMAGAKKFAGAAAPREAPSGWFYGQKVATASEHVVTQACEILGEAVGERLAPSTSALLPAGEDRHASPDDTRRTVLIAPTAGWGAKEWPAARFGELAEWLVESGYRVLVNGGVSGGGVAEAVAKASGGRAEVARCTIAGLASLLRHASLFVGGDTGPLHLADALGVPCVALFGPTDPARNGPYFGMKSGRARVIRHAESVTDHKRHAEVEAGLSRIGVDEVLQAALALLEDGESNG